MNFEWKSPPQILFLFPGWWSMFGEYWRVTSTYDYEAPPDNPPCPIVDMRGMTEEALDKARTLINNSGDGPRYFTLPQTLAERIRLLGARVSNKNESSPAETSATIVVAADGGQSGSHINSGRKVVELFIDMDSDV